MALEPDLRVGGSYKAEAYTFFGVVGAAMLEGGTLVVGDGSTTQIRFFGPDGTHVRSIGRAGGGPGEFRSLSAVKRLAGVLTAYLLGSVGMPAGLRILEIGSDYVLGVHRDELEVERIQVHRLHR